MSNNTNRKPIICGNWKMNLNHFEAIQLVQRLAFAVSSESLQKVDVVLHPPFTDIRSVQTLLEGDRIPMILGAQDCHQEPSGAYTGEVSAPMLAKLNVRHVIAGHSERRMQFDETNEIVNAKVKAISSNAMSPILCVGETAEQRDQSLTEEVVLTQVSEGLKGVSPDHVTKVVVAYEPVWAIGAGRAATPEDAQDMAAKIRVHLTEQWGDEKAQLMRILYGGSVKPVNTAELMSQADIDGFLVGGASISSDDFARIVATVATQTVLA